MSDGPALGANSSEKSRFVIFFTTLPGLLTAIATLLTAVVGLYVALRGTEPDAGPISVPTTPTSVPSPDGEPTPVADPTTPPASPSPTVTPSPSPTPQSIDLEAPHSKGTLSMGDGDYADITEGRVSNSALTDAELHVRYEPDEGQFVLQRWPFSGPFAAISGSASKSSCYQMLRSRQDDFLYLKEDAIGVWTCVRTSDNRIGAVKANRMDLMNGILELSYVVWK